MSLVQIPQALVLLSVVYVQYRLARNHDAAPPRTEMRRGR